MQATNTRVVTFEMCGNDYLQARSSFAGQSGTCNYSARDQRARQLHELHGPRDERDQPVRHHGDRGRWCRICTTRATTRTTRSATARTRRPGSRQQAEQQVPGAPGARATGAPATWPSSAASPASTASRSTWARTTTRTATDRSIPTRCATCPGESEAAYVNRITVTLRSTIRDANTHFANASTSYDYILSDDTHPDVLRRNPELGRLRLRRGRLQRLADRGRQEPAVEQLRSRADGLGAVGLQSGDALTSSQSRKRASTIAGTPTK